MRLVSAVSNDIYRLQPYGLYPHPILAKKSENISFFHRVFSTKMDLKICPRALEESTSSGIIIQLIGGIIFQLIWPLFVILVSMGVENPCAENFHVDQCFGEVLIKRYLLMLPILRFICSFTKKFNGLNTIYSLFTKLLFKTDKQLLLRQSSFYLNSC